MKKHKAKASLFSNYLAHLFKNIMIGVILIITALLIGMVGYHFTENMPWIDAFANAAMILSGMGPLTPLATPAGKIFAGVYALFSGLVFIVMIALIFSPLLHHIFKKIHLEYKNE